MFGLGSGSDRGRRGRPAGPHVSAVMAGVLAAGVLAAPGLPGGPSGPPPVQADKPVAVHQVARRTVQVPAMPTAHQHPVSWPASGSGTAAFAVRTPAAAVGTPADPTAGSVRAGTLPLWVGPAPAAARATGRTRPSSTASGATAPATAPTAVSRVSVSMASQHSASALGLHGVVFAVSRADGSAASGQVHVSLSYAGFADAFGGGFGSRLGLVELPACALTTPQIAACRTQTPLVSANDARTAQLGADVALPAAATSTSAATAPATSPELVLAATASTQGSGGNFGAEPLSEENQWAIGGSSGAFTYSYPVQLPPVPGSLLPTVALDYDSQAVDGLNASTDNEASWIGDGWNYQPGFIENDYPTCATIAADPDTLDLCPTQVEQTLTLNGVTTPLVVTSTGAIHPEADGAQQVVQTATGYEVIEPDGTQYWFGRNQLPGYAAGDATTDSVWSVPVWQSGSFVTKPWRLMLDYIVAPKGNAIAYFYTPQSNYYAESNGQSPGTVANGAYTQGGALAKIEYGLRAGSVYTQPPAAQVIFTPETTVRQDAPTDLTCTKNAACSVHAPTFWTSYALASISTQTLVNGTLQPVDSWTLSHVYPATNDTTTAPSLWLASITRTGRDGATPLPLPPVSFAGTALPGLAATAADRSAGYSLITRYRLSSVTNENGGVTQATYSPESAACAAGTFPADYSNTGLCYPDYWWTDPYGLVDREDWYNLYDTAQVTETDTTGGAPEQVTAYTYSGPAYHYDKDTMSRSANWTWDQWRGFRSVITETGAAPDPVTETADTYLQGMSQDQSDYRFNGGVITNGQVTITSTRGDAVEDKNQFAGMKFEQITYTGAGTGAEVDDAVWLPFTSTATGGNSTLFQASYITGTSSNAVYTALAGGGSRKSTATYAYNGYGQVLTETQVPDTTDATQDTCTTNTYTVNTGLWIVDLPSEVKATGGASCATAVTDTQYTYDGGTLTQGDITQIRQLNATAAGATATANRAYDQYGRELTSQDADGRTTSTAYTPATGAEPTAVQVTDPVGLVTTTTYDPARDLPMVTTDAGGYQSTQTYDALGRPTAAWTPGNSTVGPAQKTYSYTTSDSAPWAATEQVEQPGGGYLQNQALYDALGRTRETQQQTVGGGSDVSDVSYNSDGWKTLASAPYYVAAAPSGTLVAAASSQVPSQTGYVHDGDGRVTRTISYALGAETWESDTAYGGNYTTVVPPVGGTGQTAFTDGRGLTTAVYQYHAGVPATPADPAADYDKTTYTYTAAKKLAGIIDASGNTWSDGYDQLGDPIIQTDPDAGTTTSGYDNAGQLISATEARGKQVSWTYDADGRKSAEYDTTGGAAESAATELAAWTYDTLAKGRPTAATSYQGGSAYTEQVTGYDAHGLPSGSQIVVPAAQGALAGTYTRQNTYAPTGQLLSYTDSAAGNLPAETVTIGYDAAGEPDSLNGAATYVNSLAYTNLGRPLQYQLGASSQPAYITDAYDPQTSRLTEQNTQIGTAQLSIDDLHYAYDQVGDVTSEADTPADASAATDVQCFQYDYLSRLTQAWAQGNAGCAATPTASAEGGGAPYWNTYAYNTVGDLTGVTSTTPTGATTTNAEAYPATGSARPHAVTSATVTSASGTASTAYGYDANGNLTTLAGPAQNQALTWNDAGQLTQDAVTPAAGAAQNTAYTYDANGNLLLTQDPFATTLYLPDEEISLNNTSGTVTGTRYYNLGETAVATRAGATNVTYLVGDQQNTAGLAIDAATLQITRRYFDPYGNPRGTAVTGFPAGQKGFVGGSADSATGLTDLGAREYQPALGAFISPDPLLKPYDPQNLNPYAYAQGNPATYSDPSGAIMITADGCVGSVQACEQKSAAEHRKPSHPAAQHARGSSPDPGCPVYERTCTVPAPLTKAGRTDYEQHGWVKPAPVHRIKAVNANKYRSQCTGSFFAEQMCARKEAREANRPPTWLEKFIDKLWGERVNILDYGAFAVCLIPGNYLVCAGATLLDLVVRVQARYEKYGWAKSEAANAADIVYTLMSLATGGGLAAAFTKANEAKKGEKVLEMTNFKEWVVSVVSSQSDIVSLIGNFVSGNDIVYFNSTP